MRSIEARFLTIVFGWEWKWKGMGRKWTTTGAGSRPICVRVAITENGLLIAPGSAWSGEQMNGPSWHVMSTPGHTLALGKLLLKSKKMLKTYTQNPCHTCNVNHNKISFKIQTKTFPNIFFKKGRCVGLSTFFQPKIFENSVNRLISNM